MLITHRFVLLNMPKTGSTFARTVVRDVVARTRERRPRRLRLMQAFGLAGGPYCREVMLPPLLGQSVQRRRNQHGAWRQIPRRYRKLPVVAVIRDPLSWHRSRYAFGWWRRNHTLPLEVLRKEFPNFPNLDPEEFTRMNMLRIQRLVLGDREPAPAVGPMTITLLTMFCRHPREVLARLDDAYLDGDGFMDDLADIDLLRQWRLNDDLADYLSRQGFDESLLGDLRERARINSSDYGPETADTGWSEKLLVDLRHRERLVYRLMALKGIDPGVG